MSDTPWTPGPWIISTQPHGYEVCTTHGVVNMPTEDGLGKTWCYIRPATLLRNGEWHWPDAAEQTANARLIAAAPDMAEALENLLIAGDFRTGCEDVKAARAALAKARGQA